MLRHRLQVRFPLHR
ncbi:hypothetical protein LINPERPRIM_LOCUS14753 [Linum perenne]